MIGDDNIGKCMPLLTLIETGVASPKQIVNAIATDPIYIDVYNSGEFTLADDEQIQLVLAALVRYEKKVRAENRLAEENIEGLLFDTKNALGSELTLSYFGWPGDSLPIFELVAFDEWDNELPEMNTVKLHKEGQFIAKLMVRANIDIDALGKHDKAVFAELQELAQPQVTRKTLANMLDRWGLRDIKSKTSKK